MQVSLINYILDQLDKEGVPLQLDVNSIESYHSKDWKKLITLKLLNKKCFLPSAEGVAQNFPNQRVIRVMSQKYVFSHMRFFELLRENNNIRGVVFDYGQKLFYLGDKNISNSSVLGIYLSIKNDDEHIFLSECKRISRSDK